MRSGGPLQVLFLSGESAPWIFFFFEGGLGFILGRRLPAAPTLNKGLRTPHLCGRGLAGDAAAGNAGRPGLPAPASAPARWLLPPSLVPPPPPGSLPCFCCRPVRALVQAQLLARPPNVASGPPSGMPGVLPPAPTESLTQFISYNPAAWPSLCGRGWGLPGQGGGVRSTPPHSWRGSLLPP